jgi:hypothetical protein
MKKKNILIASVASLVVIATTAFLVIKRRIGQKEEQPPRKAPQLAIDNPGDQSEFLAGPSVEEELG